MRVGGLLELTVGPEVGWTRVGSPSACVFTRPRGPGSPILPHPRLLFHVALKSAVARNTHSLAKPGRANCMMTKRAPQRPDVWTTGSPGAQGSRHVLRVRAKCPQHAGRGGRDKRSRGVGVSAEHSLRPRPCPRPRQPTSPGLGPWAWGAGDHALRKPLLLPGGDRSGRAGAAGEAIVSGLETAYGFCFKTSKLLPCEKRLHKSPPQVPPGGGPGLGRKPWPGAELWERGGRGGPVGSAQGAGRGWGARRPPRVWAPGPSLPGAVVLQLWTQVLVTVDQGPREESGVMWPTRL